MCMYVENAKRQPATRVSGRKPWDLRSSRTASDEASVALTGDGASAPAAKCGCVSSVSEKCCKCELSLINTATVCYMPPTLPMLMLTTQGGSTHLRRRSGLLLQLPSKKTILRSKEQLGPLARG
jgi:hypothetical protein